MTLEDIKFTSADERTRSLTIRVPMIIEDIMKAEPEGLREIELGLPEHTNADWKIALVLEYGKYFVARIKQITLQSATDGEIFEFIMRGIKDATKQQ